MKLKMLGFFLSEFPERLKEKKYAQQEQVIYEYMPGVVMQTKEITDILKWVKWLHNNFQCIVSQYFNVLSLLLSSGTWRKHNNLILLKSTMIQMAAAIKKRVVQTVETERKFLLLTSHLQKTLYFYCLYLLDFLVVLYWCWWQLLHQSHRDLKIE